MAEKFPRVALGLRAGTADRALRLLVGRLGIPVAGVWILRTSGRRSGRVHEVPVIPVALDGGEHLVAPRGSTDWMRNLVAAGHGELRRGRTRRAVSAEPLGEEERVPVLCAYITANRRLNGRFFDVPGEATTDDVRRIARRHPVVRLRSGG